MAKFYDAVLRLTPDPFIKGIERAEKHLDSFEKEYKRVGKSIEKTGKNLERAGKSIMKLTSPLLAFGIGSFKVGMDFESTMAKVQAISSATGDEFKQLSGLAKQLGRDTKFSASEMAEGLTYTSMAGWKTQEMLEGFPAIVDLAIASGEDLALTSDIVTDALTAFKLEAKDAAMFSDVLAAASNSSNTSVSMLGESFKYVAPVAGALGHNINDVSLALGLMANSGVKGSMAGTSLKTALTRLAKPTKEVAGGLDMIGMSAKDLEGLPLREQLIQLRRNFKDLDETQQAAAATSIFGREAMSGMLAIIGASDKDFNDLADAIDNSAGATQKMRQIMEDTMGGSWDNMKSAIEAVMINVSEIIAPTVKKVIDKITEIAVSFTELDPNIQSMIVKFGALAVAVGPIIFGVGKLTRSIGKGILGFSKLSKAVTKAGGILKWIASPGHIAVLAIVGIIAAVALLIKNWDKIKAKAEEIFPGITDTFRNMGENIKIIFGGLKDFISLGLDTLKNTWDLVWSAFGLIIEGALENIRIAIDMILGVLDGLIEFIAGVFSGNWEQAWNGIVSIFESIFGGVSNIIKNVVNTGIKYINKLIQGINSVKPPDWVPIIGGKSTNIPEIPQLERGTQNWRGGLAEINERGRKEIIDLPNGTRVIPHHKSIDEAYKTGQREMVGSGKVTYQTISIPKLADQVIFRDETDMDKFMAKLARELKLAKDNKIATV